MTSPSDNNGKYDDVFSEEAFKKGPARRRDLLPIWIKIFLWIFMIAGCIVPIGLVFSILGISFSLSLYGLETNDGFSITGIVIMTLFAIKGAVSISLWTEKGWAISLALFDAILGIAVCVFVMLILPFLNDTGPRLMIRLELIAIIPYLIKMKAIKDEWERIGLKHQ